MCEEGLLVSVDEMCVFSFAAKGSIEHDKDNFLVRLKSFHEELPVDEQLQNPAVSLLA